MKRLLDVVSGPWIKNPNCVVLKLSYSFAHNKSYKNTMFSMGHYKNACIQTNLIYVKHSTLENCVCTKILK